MLVVTATEVKNQLGDLFDAVDKMGGASVLIERNRRPVAMLLNVQLAEKAILCAYAQGVLPRAVAMEQLGLDWYGDLLRRLNLHHIAPPVASAEDRKLMRRAADKGFATLEQPVRS